MSANNPYANYAKNKAFTATGPELTLMLYDGVVKFINLAIKAIEDKDYELANKNIIRVENIIRELQSTLNMKYDIAHQFMDLYVFMYSRLLAANIKKDVAILEEVKFFALQFRDTWKEAMKIAKAEENSSKVNTGNIQA